ncbi:hypothetical protein NKH52_32305 [Mesorhizobium sp. M1066]|uniref:hypothetical protein n=1 Tax=unclassified Mesorhizobium TaxID=325217 RepID=UPI003338E2B0
MASIVEIYSSTKSVSCHARGGRVHQDNAPVARGEVHHFGWRTAFRQHLVGPLRQSISPEIMQQYVGLTRARDEVHMLDPEGVITGF